MPDQETKFGVLYQKSTADIRRVDRYALISQVIISYPHTDKRRDYVHEILVPLGILVY